MPRSGSKRHAAAEFKESQIGRHEKRIFCAGVTVRRTQIPEPVFPVPSKEKVLANVARNGDGGGVGERHQHGGNGDGKQGKRDRTSS